MAISSDEFKGVLTRWATGVTIVTAHAGDKVHGMTVSAFTEGSLEPPLVLFFFLHRGVDLELSLEVLRQLIAGLGRDKFAQPDRARAYVQHQPLRPGSSQARHWLTRSCAEISCFRRI